MTHKVIISLDARVNKNGIGRISVQSEFNTTPELMQSIARTILEEDPYLGSFICHLAGVITEEAYSQLIGDDD